MKKLLFLTATILLLAACSPSPKEFQYSWEYHYMDSIYEEGEDLTAAQIITKYQPMLADLMEIIGYTDRVIKKESGAESELSNFAADAMRIIAEKSINEPVQVGLTNYGGIRTDMPKGDVRVYDIYSIFPFNNTVVICKVKGSNLKMFFDKMAEKGRMECLSGVELVVDNKELTKCYVAGKPIDDNAIYNFAVNDFLLEGGDGVSLGSISESMVNTEVLMRDGIVDCIKDLTAAGNKIDPKKDGRIVIINNEMR